MQLVFMWKTGGSDTGHCPALYRVGDGYVVQGRILNDAATSQLRDFGDDESAVFVPSDVLDRLLR